MMRWIIIVGLLICSTTAWAQRPRFRPQVHEISLQLGSLTLIPETATQHLSPVNGLRYAYNFNQKSAFRAGIFYRNSSFDQPINIPTEYENFTAEKLDLEFRAGMMWKYHIYRLQLYAGLEGVLRYTDLQSNFNTDSPGMTNAPTYLSYGISGLVGARMFANTHVSMGIEADVYALWHDRRDLSRIPEIEPHAGLFLQREIGFQAVSVYLSYHFKRIRKSCTCGKPGT